MAHLLDTSVFIAIERGQLTLDEVAAFLPDDDAGLAALTASELLAGVYQADQGSRRDQRSVFVERALSAFPILAFDLPAARIHAQAGAELRRTGQTIGSHDLIIAATALANGYEVATLDARGFPRVPDLRVTVLQLPKR
jgi:tRNA(fMet)-specific endonuclease VapC